jgi:NAD(P)-dependent dehydrogenase (short-subunit alcohol dehydrogenase family)
MSPNVASTVSFFDVDNFVFRVEMPLGLFVTLLCGRKSPQEEGRAEPGLNFLQKWLHEQLIYNCRANLRPGSQLYGGKLTFVHHISYHMTTPPIPAVAIVTGASSGIGWAVAQLLHKKGWLVYGLSRSGTVPKGVRPLRADVTVPAEMEAAAANVWGDVQRLHLVIHAAGIGGAGPVENYPLTEARKIIETNFMGTLHLVQACLPYLRRQQYGKLLLISSIAGLVGLPFHGVYTASKFAVEGLVESLRLELRGTGVQVVSICPGDTATPIIGNQYRARTAELPAAYQQNYQRANETMTKSVAEGVPAEVMAAAILRIAQIEQPRVRYLLGDWLQRMAPALKRLLPERWFEHLLANYYGVERG